MRTIILVVWMAVIVDLMQLVNTLMSLAESEQVVYPKIAERTVRSKRNVYGGGVDFEELKKPTVIEVADWVLELNPESNLLVAPRLAAEWVSGSGVAVPRALAQCDYRTGAIRGREAVSRAAMALCGQRLTGFVHVGGSDYFLEPLEAGGGAGAHKLTRARRSALDGGAQWMFNLTGDTIDIGGAGVSRNESIGAYDDRKWAVDENERNKSAKALAEECHIQEADPEQIGYFYDNAWSAQTLIEGHQSAGSILPPRWLEVAVAVDYTVITFHGQDKVTQYVMALMNIVSAIYQDVSLEANLKLAITRLLLFDNRKQSVVRPGNAKKSLENVNSWNNRLHASLAPGEPRHDVAVWLTRADIGGPAGYAPVGGACDPKRSCALNRDEGLSSAFIIAHEMAHILGLSHDGDRKGGNTCAPDAGMGSVMAPMVAATFSKFFWSECSRDEFKRTATKWWCLLNSPNGKGEIVLNATLQNSFTMDEQCRMEFGEGYTQCRAFDIIEPCSHLWCGHVRSPLVCKTKKGPPLEGTECGFGKWCVSGYCVEVSRRHMTRVPVTLNPQHGGWGRWSRWGPCSRTCGVGVRFRARKCNAPPPLYGGSYCSGLAEEWSVCNEEPCPEPLRDMRAEQCDRLPKLLNLLDKRAANVTWLPYESENYGKKCKLICLSKTTNEILETSENLIDGTPCSYETADNICIQGICQLLGCDGQLHSNLRADACGVCGGNDTNCTTVESIFNRKLRREVSRVAVLARLARNIEIEANVTVPGVDDPAVAFVLKSRKKKKYTVTVPNADVHTEILEGTKFYYRKTGNRHTIWAKGPVLAEMVILVYAPATEIDMGVSVSLRSRYVVNKNALIESQKHKWVLGGWGPCSTSCGGGRRQQTVACWDEQQQRLARRKHCSLLAKPALKTEKCNTFDCNFQWVGGKWEPCSATCGSRGTQHRELYCIPQLVVNTVLQNANSTTAAALEQPWKLMVNPHKCSGIIPPSERACNREPCPSFWTFGEWSPCSTSCGNGVSTRSSHCPPLDDEVFFACDGSPPPFQRRVCQGHATPLCKGRSRKPCKDDQSTYCSLGLLSKYCKIGGFRKLCCKSCTTFRLSPVSV